MLNETQVSTYLHRLAYLGPRTANLATLNALHHAHLQKIAFENLDISLGKKLDLSTHALLDKLLQQGRGGFCYELNQAFALLLEALGFNVSRLSARVHNGKDYGPDFDHMLLLVHVDGQDYLADVGFGDCFRTPLQLGGEGVHELGLHYYLAADVEQHHVLMQARDGGAGHAQYRFSLQAHAISDFFEMCEYQQTSPLSHFTQKSICSIATLAGRVSMSNNKCIVTDSLGRHVHTIHGEDEYRALLQEYFGMRLAGDVDVGKLLVRQV
ncbi:arylamine N-acetyltransferase family protein [Undibacterium sp. Di27W]|uniref:arylamine N-acetyltransferase family protein n=1 Tax=Undibacterium sp. Di27W TaxID=3413036 RepID=UPI003BF0E400